MGAKLARMTLRELLQQHGIMSIKEFTHRMEFSRQQAWDLWHARAGVGKDMMKRIHERLGIPLQELIALDPIKPPKPRGSRARRPPKES